MFPEYINIISEKTIYKALGWPTITLCIIAFVYIVFVLTLLFITQNTDRCIKMMAILCIVFFPLFFLSLGLCNTVFKVPCGTKYSATIDKSKVTVEQYEEFLEEYDPVYDDGVYTWKVYEDK